jgi:hypothetical protein
MLPPVTCAPQSRQTTPHRAWSAVWVRISAAGVPSSRPTLDEVTDRRRVAAVGLELVDDLATGLERAADGPQPTVAGTDDETPIGRLAAATRVENGAIQHHGRRVARFDRSNPRFSGAGVGIRVGDLFARRGHRRAARVTRP